MKFTKTVVAVAVAGLFAVPMAASAETTLSGVAQIKFEGSDVDDDDIELTAGDVRVAVNTQQEVAGGLTAYGNLQLNVDDLTGEGGVSGTAVTEDPDDDDLVIDSPATVSSDNVYVGLKGGFGDLRFGEIPLAVEYGQVANDIYDVGSTVADGISYTGTFGPASIGLNYSLEDDSDMTGIGAKAAFGGFTFGLGYELRSLSDSDGTLTGDPTGNAAVGVSFAIAGFSIAAHYWMVEEFGSFVESDGATFATDTPVEDAESVAVQVGYGIAGINLNVTYALISGDQGFETDSDDDADTFQAEVNAAQSVLRLDAGYDLGGGFDISTRVSLITADNDGIVTGGANVPVADVQADLDDILDADDVVEYRIQLSKSF